jgi:hypothetical protein
VPTPLRYLSLGPLESLVLARNPTPLWKALAVGTSAALFESELLSCSTTVIPPNRRAIAPIMGNMPRDVVVLRIAERRYYADGIVRKSNPWHRW